MILGRVWKDHEATPTRPPRYFPMARSRRSWFSQRHRKPRSHICKARRGGRLTCIPIAMNRIRRLQSPRAAIDLRLLQIDPVAVKDDRVSDTTGWVFGTFVYGGGPQGRSGTGWTNVAAAGGMWGNDPSYSGKGPLAQTWLNPEVHMPHVGYQGRLNGPIDDPASSCL